MNHCEHAYNEDGRSLTARISTGALEDLYDQNRFLEAFALCREEFNQIEGLAEEEVGRILLFGRLAGRLGSRQLLKKIFRIAREKAPEDPLVWYFAGRQADSFEHPLRHLAEIEAFPVEKFTATSDRASWLATSSWVYAMVRDFEKAHDCLSSARELNSERAWVSCCEAEVLCLEDRWPEALTAAEKAWQLSPGMPQAAATLARILTRSGRMTEAVERILAVARDGQSQECLLTGIYYLCAMAEKCTGDECRRLARQALDLTDRLAALAPLADEDFRSHVALIRMDIGWLLQDRELMKAQADNVQHPFYQAILENLERNAASEVHVSGYTPVFQKHNTCLPTSVAAVLGHFDRPVDVDALAEELTYQGTAIWRVVDWLTRQELVVKPFIADADLTRQLLKNNLPFVLMTRSVHSYHATAAVGIDETADVVLIHDPGNIRMDKMLLSAIGRGEAPFGPEALAIVPRDQADLLAMIPDSASQPFAASLRYQQTRDTAGHLEARPIIENLKELFPDHPFTIRMEAAHQCFTGAPAAAIKKQEELLEQYPDCEHIRHELLTSLYRTGNQALIRNVLSRIVLQKKLPGVRAAQKWSHPPAEYVSQYAMYSGMVKTGYDQAIELLWNAIENEPAHAASYHVLGDVHRQEGRLRESILPYRCAATLELENHHYARTYMDVLAKSDRLREGLEFLRRRTANLGDTVAGGEVWTVLIDACEDYGFPDQAIAAMDQALARRPDDTWLLNYAVRFLGRMGLKDQEKACLEALQKTGHRPFFLSAATIHCHWSGDWRQALKYCRQWLTEEPDNIDARREMAQLRAKARGNRAALTLTGEWMKKYPGNDDFELLHFDYLKSLFEDDRQLDLLRSRLKRNPYDAWAYRELAFNLLHVIDLGEGRDKNAIRQELDTVIGKCRELCPDDAALFTIQGEIAVLEGNFDEAVRCNLEAIGRDPEYGFAYHRAWSYAAKLSEASREALFSQLETAMLGGTGFLHLAKELADMAAEFFGRDAAHRLVDKWQAHSPRDPEIAKAKANLLLNYGQGKTDAEKAVVLLKIATERFPNNADFKFILSRAYRILQDENNWLATSRAILAQFPLSSIQRRQLAEYYALHDEPQRASDLLTEGIDFAPLDEWLRFDLIALLFQKGEQPEALSLTRKSLAKIPEDVSFRHRLIDLLFDNGEEQLAVEVARAGTEVYPDGSALWKFYGDALWRSRLTADMQAVEAAYLKALQLNPRFLDAADRLAELYAWQNRFEEARLTMEEQKPHHIEQADLLTRLAWIERRAGQTAQAMDQLLDIVQRWPREHWPWRLLLEWIKDDENWDLAKTVLLNVHSVMEQDPDFASDKLYVLHQAGVSDESTEAEWARLLDDFPENEKIHCLRFDILHQEKRLDAAEVVLTAIERYDPDSPYLLARRVALKADQQQFGQAISAALRLMKLPCDVGSWCRETAWGAFRNYRELPLLVVTALDEWEKGAVIEPSFFRLLMGDIDKACRKPGVIGKWLAQFGVKPPAVRRLAGLLKQSLRRDTPNGAYTAAILEKLVDSGQRRMLLRFAGEYRDYASSRTEVWQIIGYALINGPDRESDKARRWLATWRNHESCNLWAVTNYIIAIDKSPRVRSRDKPALILENAREAVQTLPGDHTLQYVVCKYSEAALRLAQDEKFLAWVRQYRNVLEDTETDYWQQAKNPHLHRIILRFGTLLESGPEQVRQLDESFKQEFKKKSLPRWVRPEWRKRVRQLKRRNR
jgi:tetratricopeptide (TPR) repeat protein